MPAMSAKPFLTPPACLVTSPTMMPPPAWLTTGSHVHQLQPSKEKREGERKEEEEEEEDLYRMVAIKQTWPYKANSMEYR